MTRKKLFGIAGVVVVCAVIILGFISGTRTAEANDAYEMVEQIERALGEDCKKQSMTELVATIQYGDKDGNKINYYILKTTYFEADPAEVTGLNTSAVRLIVAPEAAVSCKEMKIQEWDAALYETNTLSYLCWTYSPEVSYILEYNPEAVSDEEIIKMAESAKVME